MVEKTLILLIVWLLMRQDCVSRRPNSPDVGIETTLTGLETPFQEYATAYRNLKSVRKDREGLGDGCGLDVLNWSL
jgi:hypothetical protein